MKRLGAAIIALALAGGAHVAKAKQLVGQCDYNVVQGTAMEPNPDPSCNPMLSTTVSTSGSADGWRQFRDDVCQWFWNYTLARIERYREYLKHGFNVPGVGSRPPFRPQVGVDRLTEIRFLVVGPPNYDPGVIRNPKYMATGADGTPLSLGIVESSDLDAYAAASVEATKPGPLPPSMQKVYQSIQRQAGDSPYLLHGVLFVSNYSWSRVSPDIVQRPTFRVFVRCYDYVSNYVQQRGLDYDVEPIIPSGNGFDYDLLPR